MTFDGNYRRVVITATKTEEGTNFLVRRSDAPPGTDDAVMFLGNEKVLKLDDETVLVLHYYPISVMDRA